MSRPSRSGRLVFPDLARGIGALLVVYSHIVVMWLPAHHQARNWAVVALNFVGSRPLRLEGQDLGQIAVPVFFLVSGIVMTPVAVAQGARRFVVARVLRIYPPLIVTACLAAVVISCGLQPLRTSGGPLPVTPLTLLTNATLVNFLLIPQCVFIGVTWTLLVEVIFYLVITLVLPVLRRCVWYGIAVELTFVAVVLAACRGLGSGFFLLAVSVSFIPVIVIGQVIWAVRAGQLRPAGGVALGVVAWILYVGGDRLQLGRVNASYSLALAYALLLLGIGLLLEPKLRPRRWSSFLAQRSYSIYLMHGIVLFPALDLLSRVLPVWLAIPLGLAVLLGFTELSYRYVELPARRWSSRFAKRRTAVGAGQPAGSEPRQERAQPVKSGRFEDGPVTAPVDSSRLTAHRPDR